jgi:hypothetical protein
MTGSQAVSSPSAQRQHGYRTMDLNGAVSPRGAARQEHIF